MEKKLPTCRKEGAYKGSSKKFSEGFHEKGLDKKSRQAYTLIVKIY
ncbi:hypothetical protein [Suipraeoptans intestinalis]|nr:hypothetical protein [Suipraeoptans intestinalis]MDY3121582.1 hypothetical protein [Suipraeoptans intestinalis]